MLQDNRANSKIFALVAALGLAVFASRSAVSQDLAVQQPVVGVIGARTTVSVPDRGGALIGGVSRAGSSTRRSLGLPANRSVGMFRESSQMSVHVTIQDFDELDRQALELGAAQMRSNAAQGRGTVAGTDGSGRAAGRSTDRAPMSSRGLRSRGDNDLELSPRADHAAQALERRFHAQSVSRR